MNAKKFLILGYLLLQAAHIYPSQNDWNKVFSLFGQSIPGKDTLGYNNAIMQIRPLQNDPAAYTLGQMFARYIAIGSNARTTTAEDTQIEQALTNYFNILNTKSVTTTPVQTTPVQTTPVSNQTSENSNAAQAAADLYTQIQSAINLYNQAALTLKQSSNVKLSPFQLNLTIIQ